MISYHAVHKRATMVVLVLVVEEEVGAYRTI
jgi:hypothetical protein